MSSDESQPPAARTRSRLPVVAPARRLPTNPIEYEDPAFLRTLIEEHTPRLLRKAVALCGDNDQAEDLVQATWVQVHFKRTSFQGKGSFSAWVDTILRHTYISQYRAQRRREQYELDSHTDPSIEREVPVITTADGTHDTEIRIGQLVRAILSLAPRERQVFVLRAIVGRSVRDVAHQLGRAEGTIKATFSHAVMRLRANLKAHEPE